MEANAVPSPQVSSRGTSPIRIVLVLAALGVGAYFVATNIPQYLVWTEEAYGQYWPRAPWLLGHVLTGLAAIVIGPLQLWGRIRNGFPHFHRWAGRTYVAAIALSALVSFVLSLNSDGNIVFASGLFMLAWVWLITTGMAFAAIRNGHIAQHREWMIRSYVVTFGFVTFRVVDDILIALDFGNRGDQIAIMAWAAWAVPLMLTEVFLQAKRVFRSKPRPA